MAFGGHLRAPSVAPFDAAVQRIREQSYGSFCRSFPASEALEGSRKIARAELCTVSNGVSKACADASLTIRDTGLTRRPSWAH
jgi:hypothetical protein